MTLKIQYSLNFRDYNNNQINIIFNGSIDNKKFVFKNLSRNAYYTNVTNKSNTDITNGIYTILIMSN
jgi:hypothetical protein